MKLSTIGSATACSLLCVALCQSTEARSIRADNANPQDPTNGDWIAGSPSTLGGLSIDTGLAGFVSHTYVPNSPGLQDAFNEPNGGGLNITGGTMYNYWSSNQSYLSAPQEPQDQVVVYTLHNNSGNLSFNPASYSTLAGNTSLKGDIEIDFNFLDSASKTSFTFGGVTYTATANSTPNANFLFSPTFGFLGFLNDDGNNAANVSFTPFQTGLTTLDGWTISGSAAAAPEIDTSSLISALTLLAGAMAVAQGFRRSGARMGAIGN
jgi:hypothetical protein